MTGAWRLPTPVTAAGDWQLRAACRDLDSELFFHPAGERGTSRADREDRAKRVCRACPVIQDCRRYALSAPEAYGVWGGLSEDDRRAAHHDDEPALPVVESTCREATDRPTA